MKKTGETCQDRNIRQSLNGLHKLLKGEELNGMERFEKNHMVKNKVIVPYFEDGAFAGVRVCIGDEDFIIAPKDYRAGKAMTWPEAMDALKADNLSTWDYRQIRLTMAYRKEIDKVLEDNGGDNLDNLYWICAEFSAYYSFLYIGCDGILGNDDKRYTYSVRPIKNLKEE